VTAVCEFKALPKLKTLAPFLRKRNTAGLESQTALLDPTWWFMNSL